MAQAESAGLVGANGDALRAAEEAVLQLQRRLTEQAATIAMATLEVDELKESGRASQLREDASQAKLSELAATVDAEKAAAKAAREAREEEQEELCRLREAAVTAAALAARHEHLLQEQAQAQNGLKAELAQSKDAVDALQKELAQEKEQRVAAEQQAQAEQAVQ